MRCDIICVNRAKNILASLSASIAPLLYLNYYKDMQRIFAGVSPTPNTMAMKAKRIPSRPHGDLFI
jgi:hypothetical protein